MPTDATTKKGAGPASPTPRRPTATDPTRLRATPRKHEGPEARRLRALAAGLHPFVAAVRFARLHEDDDRDALVLVLRDLSTACRRESGMDRRAAQQVVDAALRSLHGDAADVLRLVGKVALMLAAQWAGAQPPGSTLSPQAVFVDVAA